MTQPRPPLPDIRDIVRDLASTPERVEDICFELFPAGYVQEGRRFRIGSLAGDEGQSLSVLLSPDRATGKLGNWKDFSTGEGGDILDLVAQVIYGGDKKAAFRWALDRLKIKRMDPAAYERHNRDAERRAKERAKEARRRDAEKKASAWRIWHDEASATIFDTPVEFYLRDRGIRLQDAPSTGSLRFHPDLPLPYRRGSAPAMVAAVVSPQGVFLGCHRTYLVCRASGLWDRYREDEDGIDGKAFLGPISGGYISISKGASGQSLGKAPEGDKALIIEGIEDALVMAIARPDFRVLAALSLGNLGMIRLPAAVKTRVFFLDNDEHPQALAGAEKAMAAQTAYARADGAELRALKLSNAKDPNEFIRKVKA